MTNKIEKVVVTRHPQLIFLLSEMGIVPNGTKVVKRARKADIAGKDVYGILPLHLACHANSITTIQINVPVEWRGRDLTISQMREIAGSVHRYTVSQTNEVPRFGVLP